MGKASRPPSIVLSECFLSPESFRLLCRLLRVSNSLAKNLSGPPRAWAYEIKSQLISVFLVEGWALPNGLTDDGIVGIDIACRPPMRFHAPMRFLTHAAQARIYQSIEELWPSELPSHAAGLHRSGSCAAIRETF